MPDYIIAGGAAFGLIMIAYGCAPLIQTARDEFRFRRFKREVRTIWMTEVKPGEDIIAKTGEEPWWACFNMGMTPHEAVHE